MQRSELFHNRRRRSGRHKDPKHMPNNQQSGSSAKANPQQPWLKRIYLKGHCNAGHTERKGGHSLLEHMHLRLGVKGPSPADTMLTLLSIALWLVVMDTEKLNPLQGVAEDLPCGTQRYGSDLCC